MSSSVSISNSLRASSTHFELRRIDHLDSQEPTLPALFPNYFISAIAMHLLWLLAVREGHIMTPQVILQDPGVNADADNYAETLQTNVVKPPWIDSAKLLKAT
ncbi:hypothetical protein ACTXT7_013341 [Hymenolepis weldensis]